MYRIFSIGLQSQIDEEVS